MTFNMKNYWPTVQPNKQLVVQTRVAQGTQGWLGLTHRYRNSGNLLRLDNFNGTGWLDAWELRWDEPQQKMLEVGDWVNGQHLVYEVGQEIPWGGVQEIGDVINESVHVDVAASQGPVVHISNWGRQIITFEEFHPTFVNQGGLEFINVVQLHLFHSWCKSGACAYPDEQNSWSLRYWFAPKLGFIQTQYLSSPGVVYDPPRFDYAINHMTTWETP